MSARGNSYYSSCDTCRDRKLKCSKEHPCAYCLQQAISCKYSPKVTRTALTRDNLNAAEQRIRDLEIAFSILLPNANLETILASAREGTPVPLQPKSHIVAHSESNSPAQATQSENVNSAESDSEALPLEADGFDWTENAVELNELSDGMAALSIKPEGAGYLGATSSVVPLRAILGPLGNNHDINSPRAASDFPGQKMTSGDIFSMNLLNFNQTSFVDAYFQFYHTQYPFIHEPTFRAQFEGASPQPKGHSWSILLNTVLAIGAWSIGDDQSTMDDVFYNEVNRLCTYSSVFESGNLALVQALLLLSNYTQKRNRPNTGWNYLGLAVRMGLSLGLHKEFPKWEISHLQREIRRRVWWGIYIFDSGASITFGRPILLPEPGIMDTHQIMNIQENSLTPSTTSLPEEIEAPTIYSGLIAQSNFHSIIKSLYNRLLAHPEPSPQELLDLEKPIDVWEESIPAYFQISNPAVQTNADFLLSRYRLCWRSWNVRIVLFRPVILRWATKPWKSNDGTYNEAFEEIQCRQRCLENARATIESISEFMSNNISSRLGTWYLLYFLFQAGLIPIISLMTDPTHPDAPSWLELIQTTKTLLTFTSAYNQLAARCLEVVDRLCAPVLNDPEPEVMLQNPDLFDGAQAMYMGDQFGTMEFWDWSNIVLQGGGEL